MKQALAARLRELRHAKGWSQEALAERAEMHRTYLAGIERSLRNPSLENLIKLANGLGVSLSELFTFSETLPATRAHPVGSAKNKHRRH